MSVFDAGALQFKLQTVGAQVFKQDQESAKQAVEKTGQAASKAATDVDKLGKSSDETGKKSKAAKAPLDDQAKSTKNVGDESEQASKKQDKQKHSTQEQAAAAKDLSRTLLIAGAAVGAVVTLAIAKNTEFAEAMSQTRAATMATAAEQKTLGDAALKAGADTAFSATEAANAEEELAKAGVSVADIVGGSLNGALALAAAGQLGVARSAEVMATTLIQFGLTADKSGHVADVLAAGAGKAQGSVDDLALALTYVGPLAKSAGWSIDETAGTLAYFASQGILGEKAGTSLRGVLAALQAPSRIAQKTMDEYGLSVYDANGKMLSASQMAAQLQGAFHGLTDEERNAAMGRIFGNESLTAATLLYNGGADAIKDWTDQVNDSGFAAEQAAMRQDNLAGDIEKLGGAFDTALIKSGSTANDVLRDMVQALTGMVDMFGEAPDAVQGTVFTVGVAAGAIALFAGGAVAARTKFIELKATLDAANVSMRRTALIGGIAGLALTGVITVVAMLASQQAEARAKAQAYADTLEEGSHRITKATGDMASENLAAKDSFLWWETPSAYDRAEELGVSLGTLKDAALGSTDALEQLKDMQDKANQAVLDAMNAGNGSTNEMKQRKESIDAMVESVIGENDSINEAIDKSRKKAQADAESADASRDAADGAKTATDVYMEQADSVDKLQSQLSKLVDQINKANGVNQDAISKNIDYQDTLRKVDEQIRNIQAGTDGYAKTLDVTTQAGSDNMAMLVDFSKSAFDAAQTQLELDGNTAGFVTRLEDSRAKLIESAKQMGYNQDEAQALADKILAIPSQKEIDMIMDTAKAKADLDNFITLNNGRRVRVFVDAEGGQSWKVGGKTVSFQDSGSLMEFYAAGGVRGLTPMAPLAQMVPANTWRVVGDRVDVPELYAPLDGSPRSWSLLMEGLRRMPGVMPMADGGVLGASGSVAAGLSVASVASAVRDALSGLPIRVSGEMGPDGVIRFVDGRISASRKSPESWRSDLPLI